MDPYQRGPLLFRRQNLEHFGAANSTDTGHCRAAILHFNFLGILDFLFRFAFHTIPDFSHGFSPFYQDAGVVISRIPFNN